MAVQTYYQVLDALGNNAPLNMAQVGLIVQPQSAAAQTYVLANPTTPIFQVLSGAGATLLSITNAGIVNVGNLTASTLVFTDASKNLTSTGIGTSGQFIKGDGSLDSSTYLTSSTGVTGTGVSGQIAYWSGTGTQIGNANLTYNGTILSIAGGITFGTLGYADTNVFISAQSSVAGYNQFIIRNSSNAVNASANIIVNNNQSTATTFYGDFGMNSQSFTGSGSFNLANAVYLSATSADLVIGTTTSNAIHFVVNNGATDAVSISSAGVLTSMNHVSLTNNTYTSGTSSNYWLNTYTTTLTGGTGGITTSGKYVGSISNSTGLTDFLINPLAKTTGNYFDVQNNSVSRLNFSDAGGITMNLPAASTQLFLFQVNGSTKMFFTTGGGLNVYHWMAANGLIALSNNTTVNLGGLNAYAIQGASVAIGASSSTGTNSTSYTGASVAQIGTINYSTIVQTGTSSMTDFVINRVETSLGSGLQLLQDWQVGGVSLVKLDNKGRFFPVQAVTASAPTYVKGAVYFDTTLNKLRIGGATAWETVTSV